MKTGILRLAYYALLIVALIVSGCSYDDIDTSKTANGTNDASASETDAITEDDEVTTADGNSLPAAEAGTAQAATFNTAPRPFMTISATDGFAPFSVNVNARGSYTPDSNEAPQYKWSFGDGSPEEYTWAASHEYQNPGQYKVTLTVTDTQGNSAHTSSDVTVRSTSSNSGNSSNRPPVAKINLNRNFGIAPLTVSMNPNGSYDPDGTPLSFDWKTGDGNSANTWANEHRYDNPGSYTIQLTIKDATGKSTTASKQVNVTSAENQESEQPGAPASAVNSPFSIRENNNSPFGTNVATIRDWVSSQPFVNLFKTARDFKQHSPAGIAYDENGWPSNLNSKTAITYLIPNMVSGAIPYGEYTVLYDGNGFIDYRGEGITVKQRRPGRDVIEIKEGGSALTLSITNSNTDNYLRNIRVLMPGGICQSNPLRHATRATDCSNGDYLDYENHYEEIIFNPDYLRFLASFKVLRFMEFMDTNNSGVRDWSHRTKLTKAVWGGNGTNISGAPVEIMVELANRLNADPWFTLPHLATDDYVRKFAQYVRQNLNPDLKAYVEYSNEVWNSVFNQTKYSRDRGQALNLDSSRDDAGLKFYSKRSVEVFKIWENVYGGTDGLVRVLASQSAVPNVSKVILTHNDAYKHADVLAIAPYFGGDPAPFRNTHSLDSLFSLLKSESYNRSLSEVRKEIRKQAQLSSQYDLSLIAYEGGQHLSDWTTKEDDQHPNPLFYKANRDGRMGQLYTQHLHDWKAEGGQMFVQFSSPRFWDKFGSWGLKEHLNQPDSVPKYKAVMDFGRNNPQWW